MGSDSNKDSTGAMVQHSYTVKIVKNSLPTTVEMVEKALIELHSMKGVTWKQLLTFIAGKYVIVLTNVRKTLMKKHLKELWKSEDVINITGKGLNGRFKLANKKKMLSDIETRKQISKSRRSSSKERRHTTAAQNESTLINFKSSTPPSLQVTPTTPPTVPTILAESRSKSNFKSMFDTPVSSLPANKRLSGRRI